MSKYGISELDAAIRIAHELDKVRGIDDKKSLSFL